MVQNIYPGLFQVRFEVEHEDRGGNPAGSDFHLFTFDVGDQPVSIVNPRALPPSPTLPNFHVTFELETTSPKPALTPSAVDPSLPLFTVKFRGDYGGVGAVVGVGADEGEKQPTLLRAFPSVMRSRTILRLAVPSVQDAEFRIYDVTGRLVRVLVIPAGHSQTVWYGRDASGRTAPAGVYFVQAAGVPETPTTRIVKLQ